MSNSLDNPQCFVCASVSLDEIFSHKNLPKYNLNYFSDKDEALNAERNDVCFVLCQDCGFLFNKIYHQLDYKIEYDASRSQSNLFSTYLTYVSECLIKNVKDNITKVVEVGAGDCSFAKLLSITMPDVEYSCYDPSWKVSERDGRINKVGKLYENEKEYPNLVIARHVLEHQSDVRRFIATIAHENPEYIFIEIPCSSYVMKGNYHYFSNEHCSYLEKNSLNMVMGDNGYREEFIKYVFNGENIIALYKKDSDYIYFNDKNIKHNATHLNNEFSLWKDTVKNKINENDILWGAGGKGVMMMNILDLDCNKIPFIVDTNINISGKFIPITCNEIIHPSQLKKHITGKVIVMSKPYLKEINDNLSQLGISADIIYIGDL